MGVAMHLLERSAKPGAKSSEALLQDLTTNVNCQSWLTSSARLCEMCRFRTIIPYTTMSCEYMREPAHARVMLFGGVGGAYAADIFWAARFLFLFLSLSLSLSVPLSFQAALPYRCCRASGVVQSSMASKTRVPPVRLRHGILSECHD